MTQRRIALCGALILAPLVSWAGGGGGNDPELGAVHLTPEQEQHLQVQTAEVEEASRPSGLHYRGVLVPSARGGGAAFGPSGGTTPEVDARAATGWATAVEAVRVAEADERVAEQELERASRLADGDAGSERRRLDAQAAIERARASLRAAREREAIARRLLPSRDGNLWVRVSVYVGDIERIDERAPATVRRLGRTADPGTLVTAVEGPPTADPAAATLDLFYDGSRLGGRAGQVVAVELYSDGRDVVRAVPSQAVVFDPAGVAWVFVPAEPGLYVRRRVEVIESDAERALLGAGPEVGEQVVTDGVAEIYGRLLGMGE